MTTGQLVVRAPPLSSSQRASLSTSLLVVGGVGVVFGAIVMMASGLVGGVVSYDAESAPRPVTFYELQVKGIPFVNTDFVAVTSVQRIVNADGTIEFAPMLFERVFNGPDELNAWRERVEDGGQLDLHDVKITQYDVNYQPIRTVLLESAWPSQWKLPPMSATGDAAQLERFALTFDKAVIRKRNGNPRGGADGRKPRK